MKRQTIVDNDPVLGQNKIIVGLIVTNLLV